jgi:hypothetical protein
MQQILRRTSGRATRSVEAEDSCGIHQLGFVCDGKSMPPPAYVR